MLVTVFIFVAAAVAIIGHGADAYRAGGDTFALFLQHHHAPKTTSIIAMNRRRMKNDRILVMSTSSASRNIRRIRQRLLLARNYVEMEQPKDDDDEGDDSFFIMASQEAYRQRIQRMRNTKMEDPLLPKALASSASIGEKLVKEMLHDKEEEVKKNSLLNSSSSTTTTEKDNERLHRSLLESRLAYDAIDAGLLAAIAVAEPKPYEITEPISDTSKVNDGRSRDNIIRTGGDDEEQLHRSLLETRLAYEAIDSGLLAAVVAAEPKPYDIIAEYESDEEALLKSPKSSTIHESVVSSLLETLDETSPPPKQLGRRLLSSDGKELFEPSNLSSMEVNEENVNAGLYVLTRSLVALKSILEK